MKKWMLMALLTTLALWAQAACPTWPTAERFTLNGAEVTDKRTGLVWARCSLGQSWNGSTCTGTAGGLTHEAALLHAAGQSGWRRPTIRELSSLADRGCTNPSIDSVAFPATSTDWYWSSSPYVRNPDWVWFVRFGNGQVDNYTSRNGDGRVRLVRASPQ